MRIESGRQVGLTFEFLLSGERCWGAVAVQKWEGRYKVYVDEVLERNMSAEVYEREELRVFDTVEDAARYVDEHTRADFGALRPCKGQRIFNPALDG
jgi:hypothetical protein